MCVILLWIWKDSSVVCHCIPWEKSPELTQEVKDNSALCMTVFCLNRTLWESQIALIYTIAWHSKLKLKNIEVKSHICIRSQNYNLYIKKFILVCCVSGHSGPVLCLAITKQSQYLLTGSDDISIIVWDLKSLNLKLRI